MLLLLPCLLVFLLLWQSCLNYLHGIWSRIWLFWACSCCCCCCHILFFSYDTCSAPLLCCLGLVLAACAPSYQVLYITQHLLCLNQQRICFLLFLLPCCCLGCCILEHGVKTQLLGAGVALTHLKKQAGRQNRDSAADDASAGIALRIADTR